PRVVSCRRSDRSRRRPPAGGRSRVEARRGLGRVDPGADTGARVIDLKRLRDEPEYRRGIERKRVRAGLVDEVLAIDAEHRVVVQDVEALRARQNAESKKIGQAAPEDRDALREAAAQSKKELTAREGALDDLEARLREVALQLPNP